MSTQIKFKKLTRREYDQLVAKYVLPTKPPVCNAAWQERVGMWVCGSCGLHAYQKHDVHYPADRVNEYSQKMGLAVSLYPIFLAKNHEDCMRFVSILELEVGDRTCLSSFSWWPLLVEPLDIVRAALMWTGVGVPAREA